MAAKDIEKYKFKKGDKRASEAGKKSKRGKSYKKIIEETDDIEIITPQEIQELVGIDRPLTLQEQEVLAQRCKARKGDTMAFKVIAEMRDGKPNQTTDVTVTERPKLSDICGEKFTKKEILRMAGIE